MKLRLEVREAEVIPAGYGLAHLEFARRVAICYPVPLNLVMRALDSWRWKLKMPPYNDREKHDAEISHPVYLSGFQQGQISGRELARQDAYHLVLSEFDARHPR